MRASTTKKLRPVTKNLGAYVHARLWSTPLSKHTSPHIGFVHTHAKTDGGHDDGHFAGHPLVLHLCPQWRLQTWMRVHIKSHLEDRNPWYIVFVYLSKV